MRWRRRGAPIGARSRLVLRDLAVMLADSGDCETWMPTVGQERLFGTHASETTTHRVMKSADEQLLAPARAARTVARSRVWDAGARPESIKLNIDARLVTAHSDKQLATGITNTGTAFTRWGAGWMRPARRSRRSSGRGTPGPNPAFANFTVLGLAQRTAEDLQRDILVRADIGGQEANTCFSVGYELGDSIRAAALDVPQAAWMQVIDADGKQRKGA